MQASINVRAIAQGCSEYNITVVVKREDCIRALRAVHSRFYLSKTTIAMGIIGPGLIGGTLLDQLRDQVHSWLYLHPVVHLRVYRLSIRCSLYCWLYLLLVHLAGTLIWSQYINYNYLGHWDPYC